jgi:tRNA (guanine-N7-)-methyltransferase
VGKNKLARWTELGSYDNVIEPLIGDVSAKDHPIKGKWHQQIFKNTNPIVLELGCGRGEYTVGLANNFPGKNYIGIDIKGARMWRGAKTANEQGLANVAFLRTRIEFINSFFAPDEVDEIWITFPDPHPGGRNSNKRLTSPWYLNSYRLFLKDKGVVHLKTDNRELYDFTNKMLIYNNVDILVSTEDLYSPDNKDKSVFSREKTLSHPESADLSVSSGVKYYDSILSIRTHYEDIFLKAGLKITYLAFRLEKEKNIEDATIKTKTC